ncbi:MAG: DUF1801 domain-containing protein [Planctomycetes bacterium]|nr:DUF1801 domain-containing protein [Planctomycetota bacterium]
MPSKPQTIDEYLSSVTKQQRPALERLRKAIRAAAPKAEECISYGLAAFRLDGRMLVAFGAATNHCAFFPMSGATVAAFAEDLKGYDTSKGTIRFPANKPLPAALVRKLVNARIAENAAKETKKKPARPKKKPSAPSEVDDFLRRLDHPLKPVLEAIRKIILGVNPKITEGIKWNAPSFSFKDYFATAGVQSSDFVRVVLHRGGKAKDNASELKIADPTGLLEWHAKDRCSARFFGMNDLRTKTAAFRAIVRQWIKQM